MVSFWPWSRDDSSAASFEKTLSALSTKIADSQARLDRTRATSRRVRVLWMLYLSFAYLIYSIVLILVVGYPNLGPWDWAGVALGPVLIYVTRTVISAFFNFRTESLAAQLKQQQDERTKTIQKLKDATRYDSTLQLLEKYGGGDEGRPSGKGKQKTAQEDQDQQNEGRKQLGRHASSGRTTMPPPPTANIQRREGPMSGPGTPQPDRGNVQLAGSPPPPPQANLDPSAEFAPNAFAHPPPQQHYAPADRPEGSSQWYDRILDLLLGEDETAPKNRIALICQNCRLVNGQAPPGTKTLAEVGIWKCMSCGASNGEADEGERIVKEVLGERSPTAAENALAAGEEFKEDDDEEDDEAPEMVEAVDVGGADVGDAGVASGKHSAAGAKKRRGRKG